MSFQLTHLQIKNFRGVKSLQIKLDKETVLIGENNTGKTSVLHSIRHCLERLRSKKGIVFDEYDFHLTNERSDPSMADPIEIIITCTEPSVDAWDAGIVRATADFTSILSDDRREIRFKLICKFDSGTKEFSQEWVFLDASGNPMTGKAAQPISLSTFQNLLPVFYLSAIRDAGREFSKGASFWGPFLKKNEITPELKNEIESGLSDLNTKVVAGHQSFDHIVQHLTKMEKLLRVGSGSSVSIEAVPGRIFDLLSKAQVNIKATSGARLPIVRHGEGTQSIAVLLLFDAFLKARLASVFDKNAMPVLALEEPEAHLHPSAIRTLWSAITALEGQRILSTHSGDLVAELPLTSIRRLYRKAGAIEIGQMPEGTLTPDELRKFNFHIKRSRGELLFANCWVLVEGETEDVVLRETAKMLSLNLEFYGIRILPYQQAGIETYLKVAEALGINWIAFLDGDPNQGAKDKVKCESKLAGRNSAEMIFQHTGHGMEHLMCNSGFGKPYEALLTQQTRAKITKKPTDAGYYDELLSVLGKYSKPAVALEATKEMEAAGLAKIPPIVKSCLEAAKKVAEA